MRILRFSFVFVDILERDNNGLTRWFDLPVLSTPQVLAAQNAGDTTEVVAGTGDTVQDTRTDIPIAGDESSTWDGGERGERDG